MKKKLLNKELLNKEGTLNNFLVYSIRNNEKQTVKHV